VPNTAHIPRFTLYDLWSRTYTVHLQLLIFRPQYSAERICADIGDIPQINARYNANLVPYIAHTLQFKLCERVVPRYTMQIQFRIIRLQFSTERICAAIGEMPTFRCALQCKLGAKYSANPPVYAIWTVVPNIYKAVTSPHIQSSIFNWMYLRCYWRYLDNSMSVILQSWCHIQPTSSSIRYVNCGPDHIQWNDSSAYSGFNMQVKVSALIFEIYRQFNERYTANLVSHTAHIVQFTMCELWSRTYTM
jgi:hypothetical protein